MQLRQGDVFLVQVKELPREAKATKRSKGIVLAEGEVTGHAHVLERGRLYITEEEVERRFVEITQTTDLVHEEHDTISVPSGIYEVRRQREYSPEAIRTVAD